MAGASNIRFVGYVDDASLGVLYRHAKAYLFPSFYEGFGLPGLEAMAYGTPVVAAEAGSLPEIYGQAATYFNPNQPPECIQALSTVLKRSSDNPERREGFLQAGKFSWRRMAMETKRLYETHETKRY
jgi:glycosyltransferase involved in cell wall biosynthesis